jgi:hypothetical protein
MLLQDLEKKDLIKPPEWLATNVAYLTIMGSHAYGTADVSDKTKKSCGCKNFRLRGSGNPKWSGYEEISGSYWHRVKQGAKSRKIDMKVSIEDAWSIFVAQGRKCALSGTSILMCPSDLENRSNLNLQTASLDRIDNDKGYIPGNIQLVHKDINRIKTNLSEDYFVQLCRNVASHHGQEFRLSDNHSHCLHVDT